VQPPAQQLVLGKKPLLVTFQQASTPQQAITLIEKKKKKITTASVKTKDKTNTVSTTSTAIQNAAGGRMRPTPPLQLAQLLLNPQAQASEMVHTMLTSRKVKIQKTRLSILDTPPVAAASAAHVISKMWADSTITTRESIYQRCLVYLERHRLPLTGQSVVIFLQSLSVGPKPVTIRGRHQYGKDLMSILNYSHLDSTMVSMYLKGLRAMGALEPLHQAIPMPFEHFQLLLQEPGLHFNTKLALMIVWKTCARWDDVYELPLTNDGIVDKDPGQLTDTALRPDQVIIDWKRNTKATRTDPYRASRYAVITGENFTREIYEGIKEAQSQMSTTDNSSQFLTTCTTDKMDTLLAEWCALRNLPKYTVHSLKHGAINHLMGKVTLGLKVDLSKLALLTKHKMVTELTGTLIRYIQNREAAAIALGTQDITQHL